jgi:hypothetical protein
MGAKWTLKRPVSFSDPPNSIVDAGIAVQAGSPAHDGPPRACVKGFKLTGRA